MQDEFIRRGSSGNHAPPYALRITQGAEIQAYGIQVKMRIVGSPDLDSDPLFPLTLEWDNNLALIPFGRINAAIHSVEPANTLTKPPPTSIR